MRTRTIDGTTVYQIMSSVSENESTPDRRPTGTTMAMDGTVVVLAPGVGVVLFVGNLDLVRCWVWVLFRIYLFVVVWGVIMGKVWVGGKMFSSQRCSFFV